MCEWGNTIIVPCPDWAADFRVDPDRGIVLDSCIRDEIVAAWAAGVRTTGSCCGHGEGPPSAILPRWLHPDQIELARKVLRGWTLEQWQLVDVTEAEDET